METQGGNANIERYAGIPIDPNIPVSKEGEEWLGIWINPKDTYRAHLGVYREGYSSFYYTERLHVYLSSHGRAYEMTDWRHVLTPDVHRQQRSYYSYLKAYPTQETDLVEFTKEPEEEQIIPYQTLHGQTLERLAFLRDAVKKGNVIDLRKHIMSRQR